MTTVYFMGWKNVKFVKQTFVFMVQQVGWAEFHQKNEPRPLHVAALVQSLRRDSSESPGKEMCIIPFGQIIATSHDLTSPQNVAEEGKWDPLFQGNLGWWNIIRFATAQLATLVPMTDPWDESFITFIY